MKRLLVALLAAGLLVGAIKAQGVGIRLFIDGQPVGTLAGSGVQYRLSEGEIWIETAEGVFGCTLDLIFWDRYEQD